jgi:hypothetical protein
MHISSNNNHLFIRTISITAFLLLACSILSGAQDQANTERKQLFDSNWNFFLRDNADLKDYEQYVGNSRKAWHGRALVVIKSTHSAGDIKLTVTSQGLSGATLNIKTISGTITNR